MSEQPQGFSQPYRTVAQGDPAGRHDGEGQLAASG